MAEISTGKPPHYDIEYDEELTNQYMDINPSNRPTASFICYELSRWHEVVDNGAVKDRYQLAILRTFQSANEIIPTLLTELPICPKDKLTNSTICNFSISDDL
ncbi:hypothetical protein C2G38_2172424 [Gigaspora rosea]|uniref:Serine-threonine/tyrosine-protein kinase catalytic domain-containing protein n=1 Tax=Gigaspora rosea TaxID=44941 RepID=A0A397VSR9_9GLOM|nr:hypothetical protein C2G38_2172424 [Gigaspora rosea]